MFRVGRRFKILFVVFFISIVLLVYINISTTNVKNIRQQPLNYLVKTEHCQIPAYAVDEPAMMNLIELEKYKPCRSDLPLTDVIYDSEVKKHKLRLIRETQDDCYFADDGSLDAVQRFTKEVYLRREAEFVYVICRNILRQKSYMNFHIIIPFKPEVSNRAEKWRSQDKRPPSVLVFGIDTMSRLNFFRTMPATSRTVLEDTNEWFPLEGYNKVGLNTFPNLMAVLKGWAESDIYRICDPVNKYLDLHCPLIWKDFRKRGYVTAYAEDFDEYSTFKFLTKGFKDPPTDYFFTPIFEKATKLESQKCIAYKYEPEYVYEYALDFARRFKDTPYFGFFWTNDFSHHYISEPSAIDISVNKYLVELLSGDLLDNTIVFLMSDHGVRFGTPREVPYIGRHEDFLPLMYIRLPKYLKEERPDIVEALKANKNVLTSHFDTFMTLKDILNMTDSKEDPSPIGSPGCPMCRSYFKEIKTHRSCALAGIPPQYCACEDYSEPCDSKTSYEIGNAVIDYLNEKISKHNSQSKILCRYVDMKTHPSVSKGSNGIYRANMFGLPGGIFEGFVEKKEKENGQYELVVKNVQRIDSMGKNASERCPVEREIFEFCFCL